MLGDLRDHVASSRTSILPVTAAGYESGSDILQESMPPVIHAIRFSGSFVSGSEKIRYHLLVTEEVVQAL